MNFYTKIKTAVEDMGFKLLTFGMHPYSEITTEKEFVRIYVTVSRGGHTPTNGFQDIHPPEYDEDRFVDMMKLRL